MKISTIYYEVNHPFISSAKLKPFCGGSGVGQRPEPTPNIIPSMAEPHSLFLDVILTFLSGYSNFL